MIKDNENLIPVKKLRIYDPAMCCPTGVCGTQVDTKLIQFASFLNSLDKNVFDVKRFGLTSEPSEYVLNKIVSKMLKEEGVEVLPLIFVDDILVFSKTYPTIQALSSSLGLASFIVKS